MFYLIGDDEQELFSSESDAECYQHVADNLDDMLEEWDVITLEFHNGEEILVEDQWD